MLCSRMPFVVAALFYCITAMPANAQSLFDPKAVEGLLGTAIQGLQKELDKHKSEETAKSNPVEEKRKKDEVAKRAEEKRKQKEAARLAEEKRKKEEVVKRAEEKRKQKEAARLAEEKRKKEEVAKRAEEKRKQKEAARLAEEKRKKEEAAKLAEEKRKKKEAVISKEVDRSISNFVKAYTMKLDVEKTIQKAEKAFQNSTELADRIESWIKKDNLAP